jgi:hypothetical protein
MSGGGIELRVGSGGGFKIGAMSGGRRRSYTEEMQDTNNQGSKRHTKLGNANIKYNQAAELKGKATPSFHDYNLDMQLEDLSPNMGGGPLQLSTSQDEYAIIPNKATISTSRLDYRTLLHDECPKHH